MHFSKVFEMDFFTDLTKDLQGRHKTLFFKVNNQPVSEVFNYEKFCHFFQRFSICYSPLKKNNVNVYTKI